MNHWTARRLVHLAAFIIVAELVGIAGTYFTFDSIPTWYATLLKPSFAPPNWLFGPVWTVLYALMGTAAFFVWEQRSHKTHAAGHALVLDSVVFERDVDTNLFWFTKYGARVCRDCASLDYDHQNHV
jgi:tryptophan-rich sensory protein